MTKDYTNTREPGEFGDGVTVGLKPNAIEQAITEHFGGRCPDFSEGCACCDAWAQYDALVAGGGARRGQQHTIAHDGFSGQVIGHYTTLEGKPGVNLQLDGARVVHVYGTKWIEP